MKPLIIAAASMAALFLLATSASAQEPSPAGSNKPGAAAPLPGPQPVDTPGTPPVDRAASPLNNTANRKLAAPPTEAQRFDRLPGDRATPKKDWKTGDARGKRGRKHKRTPRKAPAAPGAPQ